MKFKIILLIAAIITILSIGFAVDKSNIHKDLLRPKEHTLNHKVNAASFIPEDHKQYIYLKDTSGIYKRAQSSGFYKDFKNNNLLLDLKYTYGEDVDLFFTKFNMEFEDLLKFIKSDSAFGFNRNGFFIAASLTYKSKIITSVFNISRNTSVNNQTVNNKRVYSISKESSKIYYVIINEYILFADNINTISTMIKRAEEVKNLNYNSLDVDTIVYKRDINYRENPFELFPIVKDLEVHYNIRTKNLNFSSAPPPGDFKPRKDKNYHETLKLLSYDTPLVYYNSSYPLGDIISSFTIKNSQNFKEKLSEAQGGVYFVMEDLEPLLYDEDPSLGLIVNINPGYKDIGDELVELSQEVLGLEWVEDILKDGVRFLSSDSESFFMVVEDGIRYGLFSNRTMAENYSFRVMQPTSSLYDRFESYLGDDKDTLESYACINTKGVTDRSIDLVERYIRSSINMSDDEYNESFGPFINYFSGLGDGYVEFVYNKNDKKFNGKLN